MPVSVFALLPSQETLRESASAQIQRRAPSVPLDATKTPSGFTIDPSIPAVAIGTGTAPSFDLQSLQPEHSEKFVVTGTLAVDDPSDVPPDRDGVRFFSDPVIAPFITCGQTPPVGGVSQVISNLSQAKLAARGLDGANVAIVIMDTGINIAHVNAKRGVNSRFDASNSWSAPGLSGPAPFKHPVDHGTMCAFDALIVAPHATLIDYPILSANVPGGAMTGSTLKIAFLAYANLLANWGIAFATGDLHRYAGLVVNNSWGIYHPSWDFPPGHPGRYIDNPQHPFNVLVASLAGSGVDILFAAGNCGTQCPDGRCQGRAVGSIMGANASASVLTVAGCDTNDQRVGYSSQGPSIANMPQQKPDITAYAHFLGSEYSGSGDPDGGTSAACPVAAGCVAALRTKLSHTVEPPVNLFARLCSSARPGQGMTPGTWNGDYGWGIIDPNGAGASAGV